MPSQTRKAARQAEPTSAAPASLDDLRMQAARAQGEARHADAVTAFESALSHLPTDPASAGRDANAARVQMLVRLARSRLALGQATEAAHEMQQAEATLAALEGQIPARPLDMVRAAVLANLGVALAGQNRLAEAEAKFEAGIGLIDRLAAPELAGLRDQTLASWAGALRAKGRGADAEELVARLTRTADDHHAACGCGHDHHGHGAHGHGHHHHPPGSGQHAHHDHHGHGDACGCGSHSH